MLLNLYVEALLADPERADQVWELWNAGVITDGLAAWAWSGMSAIRPKSGIQLDLS